MLKEMNLDQGYVKLMEIIKKCPKNKNLPVNNICPIEETDKFNEFTSWVQSYEINNNITIDHLELEKKGNSESPNNKRKIHNNKNKKNKKPKYNNR